MAIHGQSPQLIGKTCDAIVCQEFYFRGEVVDPFNLIFLQFDGVWYRLCLDWGDLFWSTQSAPPCDWEEVGIEAKYMMRDFASKHSLMGLQLSSYDIIETPNEVQVLFMFAGNRQLRLASNRLTDKCVVKVS